MNAATFYPLFLQCNKVTIDSRNIELNDLFFAFSGETYNAALKAEESIQKGALAVIVEDEKYADPEKNIFHVPSTLQFLQELAVYHRNQLKIPIIGLTGSNGKTTTKELIHAVLSQKFKVQYTSGNLNNHIGVPLTILSIKPEHEVAVIEMGANHQKEIEFLCTLAQPNIGYITNFGKAHLEGFGGFEGVIKGKSELYSYLKAEKQTILVNEKDALQAEKTADYETKITFGLEASDYYFEPYSSNNFVGFKYGENTLLSKLTGDYNFTNLCAAVALGFHFGVNLDHIKTAIENYTPTNMRSQIVEKNGKILVLDTYNANPSSMVESLKNFAKFNGTKTIIIGDMLELGEESTSEHSKILAFAESLDFDEIITVGPIFQSVNRTVNAYVNAAELSENVKKAPISSENILLKGSRGIALEKVLNFIV
ncbi:UDP-N-acetylmuramoyl-tripeptide--D-alanyl-D-alanine ligase [Kaistella treverensis]|uniref:UDP-N-acetylmuramoyl-tripeptide--D-alanyl-D-alanine ligase n=1 Tax=Kaistella treverensis TaxID=631455 RepID=A0A1I3KLW9_9FLAO|nr:UDP-N-acetylmuramoyl-tripeptide--D-alanyl-D-alanine ligase [Kaistella treverensis]SFI73437.1 UDP-N-acetylmuramoyl-tripeptide--D-alanyl-D-alanine ligase [Kaistella treverensis]